jgi:hypothetical protein
MNGDISVDSKLGKGSSFTFFVACDLIDPITKEIKNNSGPRVSGGVQNENHQNEQSLPSEFSHVANRMRSVFPQFQHQIVTSEPLVEPENNHSVREYMV